MQNLKLALEAVVWDNGIVPRAVTDHDTVHEYCEIGRTDPNILPPIDVFFDGVTYFGADGRHRWEAAEQRGDKTILAQVHKGTRKDAIWFAAGANRRMGCDSRHPTRGGAVLNILSNLALTNSISDSQISVQVGCSSKLVSVTRKSICGREQHEADASDPPARTVMLTSKHGTQYRRRVGGNKNPINPKKPSPGRQAVLAKKIVRDCIDQPIPEWAKPIAAAAADWDGVLTMTSELLKAIEKLHDDPTGAGVEIDIKQFVAEINEIRTQLQGTRFYAVCDECRARKDGKVL